MHPIGTFVSRRVEKDGCAREGRAAAVLSRAPYEQPIDHSPLGPRLIPYGKPVNTISNLIVVALAKLVLMWLGDVDTTHHGGVLGETNYDGTNHLTVESALQEDYVVTDR